MWTTASPRTASGGQCGKDSGVGILANHGRSLGVLMAKSYVVKQKAMLQRLQQQHGEAWLGMSAADKALAYVTEAERFTAAGYRVKPMPAALRSTQPE
jgi:hypothetical protein